MLSIGLMSGTSMDGIDAALLKTDGTPDCLEDHGALFIPYDPHFTLLLKGTEYAVKYCQGDLRLASKHYHTLLKAYLQNELNIPDLPFALQTTSLESTILHSTQYHAFAVKQLLIKTGYQPQQIDVVGFHGQTLFHQPARKMSIVIGDGQYLADQLGITVVNDFRRRDILAGGQGAPFAPLYHQALAIRSQTIPLAVVNCGGIANISLIQGKSEADLFGLDTGPGNVLLDKLIRQRSFGKEQMDKDGQYAKKGKVHETVLHALYEKAIIQNQQSYFSLPPPKSLDSNDLTLIPELDNLSLEDACATLAAFTADSIIQSTEKWYSLPQHWILAGGGWKNLAIYHEFKMRLQKKCGNEVNIQLADEANWNAQAMEAQLFAYFAVRSLQNKALSLPTTTNVPYPLSGGQAYLPTTPN